MANPNPMNRRERGRFLVALDEDELRHFARLERLLGKRADDLRWHWRFGRCVRGLRGGRGRFPSGRELISDLARALNCSDGLLYKSLVFAERFPNEAALTELEALGLRWSLVAASFALEEKHRPRDVLQRAHDERWTQDRMRQEVRRLRGAPGHVSGREPRGLDRKAPEAELHGLVLRAQEWNRYVESAWLGKEEASKERPPAPSHLETLAAQGVSEELRGLFVDAARALQNTVRLATRLRGALRRLAEAPRRPKP
jgi:hypothetical protein